MDCGSAKEVKLENVGQPTMGGRKEGETLVGDKL